MSGRPWRLRAVDYRAEVRVADPAFDEYLRRVFADLVTDDDSPPDISWSVERGEVDDVPGWALVTGGNGRLELPGAGRVTQDMLQTLNNQAAMTWSGAMCHAGCVSRDGTAMMLPADPDAGKTTLTTGLVRAGFDYVTDEGVAFTAGTTHITPYPKPLALDEGSWFLFPELEPHADLPSDDYKHVQWHVPASAIRPDAVSKPCDAHWIVFPTYMGGGTTELRPIGRAEALVLLAKNTFNFNQHSREYLEQLEVVVRACDCYQLDVGTLDGAVECIEGLFADA